MSRELSLTAVKREKFANAKQSTSELNTKIWFINRVDNVN